MRNWFSCEFAEYILIDWLNKTTHLKTDRRKLEKKVRLCHLPTAGASYSSPRSISGAEYASEPQLVINIVPG